MSVRAKMTVVSISNDIVNFECQYDSKNSPEDNSFSQATPWGTANFAITNPEAHKQFEEGKAYYFDITPVEQNTEE